MNDLRRSILWVVFGFSMIMLWDRWQVYSGHGSMFAPSNAQMTQDAQKTTTKSENALNGVPSGVSNVSSNAAATGNLAAQGAQIVKSERFEVTTDVLKLTFDTQGARIVRSELLKHKATEGKEGHFILLDSSSERVYEAQSGLSSPNGAQLPNHHTPMTVTSKVNTLQEGANELKISFESDSINGVKLIKTYVLKRGLYEILVTHDVVNTSNAVQGVNVYTQLVRDGNALAGESNMFYSTFTGPVVYTDAKKYQKVSFESIEKNKASYEKQAKEGYVGMVQHYFFSAWIAQENALRDIYVGKIDNNLYRVGTLVATGNIEPQGTKSVQSRLYIGPQEERVLEKITPGLEAVKDYGWVTILAKPLYWLLEKLHSVINNWGWAIVALVVILKIAFYWFNAKAYASMANMKKIAPKLTELRERYKDKPQELQMAMMKVYREEKINPLGGCLPIFIQMPVFIALYWVLLSSVEMRGAPWILWIKDLSIKDPYYILPLIMTATTVLQTWLNPKPTDPMQEKMMWFMPLAFSVMFFFFPSGLVLYWITNNVLSILQQWIINKRLGVS